MLELKQSDFVHLDDGQKEQLSRLFGAPERRNQKEPNGQELESRMAFQ